MDDRSVDGVAGDAIDDMTGDFAPKVNDGGQVMERDGGVGDSPVSLPDALLGIMDDLDDLQDGTDGQQDDGLVASDEDASLGDGMADDKPDRDAGKEADREEGDGACSNDGLDADADLDEVTDGEPNVATGSDVVVADGAGDSDADGTADDGFSVDATDDDFGSNGMTDGASSADEMDYDELDDDFDFDEATGDGSDDDSSSDKTEYNDLDDDYDFDETVDAESDDVASSDEMDYDDFDEVTDADQDDSSVDDASPDGTEYDDLDDDYDFDAATDGEPDATAEGSGDEPTGDGSVTGEPKPLEEPVADGDESSDKVTDATADGDEMPDEASLDEAGHLFVFPPDGTGSGDDEGDEEVPSADDVAPNDASLDEMGHLFIFPPDVADLGDDEWPPPLATPAGAYDGDEVAVLLAGGVPERDDGTLSSDRRLRRRAIGWFVAALLMVVALVAVMMTTCGKVDSGDMSLDGDELGRSAVAKKEPVTEPEPVSVPEPEPEPVPASEQAPESVVEEPAGESRLAAIATGIDDDGQCDLEGWTDMRDVILYDGIYGKSSTIGVRGDGTVVATDSSVIYGWDEVSGWTDLVAFDGAGYYSVGVRSDGTVVTTHSEDDSKANRFDFSDWEGIVDVYATRDFAVGLRDDGTLCITGCPSSNVSDNIGRWVDVKQITGSGSYIVGVTNLGFVFVTCHYGEDATAGASDVIALPDLLTFSDMMELMDWEGIDSILVDARSAIGVRKDGTVVIKKTSGAGVYADVDVSGWRDIVAASGDDDDYVVGVRSDGTVVSSGVDSVAIRDVSRWRGVRRVDCGKNRVVALCDENAYLRNRQVKISRKMHEWDKEVAAQHVRDRYNRLTTDDNGISVGSWFSYRIPDGWVIRDSIALLAYELPDDLVPDPYEIKKDGTQGTWTEQDIEIMQWQPGEYDGDWTGIGGGRWDGTYTAATDITYKVIIPMYDFVMPGESYDTDTRIYLAEWEDGYYGIATSKYVDTEVVKAVLDSFVPKEGVAEKLAAAGLRHYD